MARKSERPWAAILPLDLAEDRDLRARLLNRVAARLHDVVGADATPQNTELVWTVLRLRGPGVDELEAAWTVGSPVPEWATYLRLSVRRR